MPIDIIYDRDPNMSNVISIVIFICKFYKTVSLQSRVRSSTLSK